MAKRIEKRKVSSRVKRYGSLLIGISACLVSNPAFADGEGSGFAQAAQDLIGGGAVQAQKSKIDSGELSYDDALKEMMKTNDMTKSAEKWGGGQRVRAIREGEDPQKVIQEELIQTPEIMGMESGPDARKAASSIIKVDQPLSAAQKVQLNGDGVAEAAPRQVKKIDATAQAEEEGWDWAGKQQAAAPVQVKPKAKATGFTTVFDAAQPGSARPKATPVSLREQTNVAAEPQESAAPAADEENVPADETAVEPEQDAPPKSAAAVAKEAVAIYNSAVKLHLAGKLEEAITEYREALNANPELSQAHCNLGLIFNQQHDYGKAITEFRKALAIEPKDAITYNGIGAALRAQKDMEGAIKNWSTAVSIDPHLATAHYNLGTVYEMQKDYDRAIESYSLAIKNDFRLGEAYYRTGLIYLKKNRSEDAKEQFNKALQVSKNAEFCADARKRIALIEHPPTR
ncbi:MAG: tetratricopeptide repeat protein [Candidatus Melainabacteria bacterium]|nr:tetratricopeptide repeat protein [Candidatus Melainabacteria bacterium]